MTQAALRWYLLYHGKTELLALVVVYYSLNKFSLLKISPKQFTCNYNSRVIIYERKMFKAN